MLKNKSIWIILMVVILALIIAFVAFSKVADLFVGLFAVANPELVCKIELSNPFIDNNYAQWKNVSVSDFSFKIPEQWSFEKSNQMYAIEISDCQQLGYAAEISENDQNYSTISVFLQEITNESFDYSQSIIQSFSIEGATCSILDIPNTDQDYYSINLRNYDSDSYFIIILTEYSDSEKAQATDIAEAIMYSFVFKDG